MSERERKNKQTKPIIDVEGARADEGGGLDKAGTVMCVRGKELRI